MSRTYRLLTKVEAGELAEQFVGARDDGHPVAVKLFHAKTSDVRYARELAETSRSLNPIQGDGLIRILDVGLVKGRLAVVREHVDGLSLGEALVRLGTREVLLPPTIALHFVIQLLDAVQRAHDAGVVHGALTPANVWLSREGQVGVFDFGALRALQAVPALKALTHKGRDSYRGPEVVKGDAPDEASDIYSIGAIAYELLTLREPTVGSGIGSGMGSGISTRREALPGPSRVDRRLNGRLDPIILRALDPMPNRRFRSCAELAAAIRNFLANNGGVPAGEEIRKFVSDVSPREAKTAAGAIPFAEPFALSAVEGADVPPVAAMERLATVERRAAFSEPSVADPDLAPYAQDTVEAPPAFEEYKPSHKAAPSALPRSEPKFEDGTDPGTAGPLEMGWEAPPGAAPPPPRRMSLAAAPVGRTSARAPRVKVIEDFAVSDAPRDVPREPEPAEEKTAMATAADRRKLAAREKSAPRPAPKPVSSLPPIAQLAGAVITPVDVVPRDLSRPATTGERELHLRALRRKRLGFIALGIAIVGVVCFAAGVNRYRHQRRPAAARASVEDPDAESARNDPGFRSVDGALKRYLEESAPPPASRPAPPKAAEKGAQELAQRPARSVPVDEVTFDDPPPRSRAGFLSVTTDVPAAVYIDGMRVKKKAPFARYPVRPGERRIVVECLDTLERGTPVELTFAKGRERKLEEHCKVR